MSIFCKYPFVHVCSDTHGMMVPCCNAATDHPNKPHIKSEFPCRPVSEGIFSYRDIPEMRQLRLDMMKSDPYTDLVKDVCRKCIHAEEHGIPSMREPLERVPVGRRTLQLKLRIFGNTCNLSCYMCNIKHSSTRIRQTERMMKHDEKIAEFLKYDDLPEFLKTEGGYDLSNRDPEAFNSVMEEIKKFASKIDSVVIIGGEPFVMGSHYKFLDTLIESGESENIEIKYTSNLTTLEWKGCRIEEYFDKFKLISICWSVEGYKDADEYIRFPTDWETIVRNYRKLLQHPKTTINTSVTLSALTIIRLDELINFTIAEGLDLSYNQLISPQVCSIGYLHPKVREKLSKKYAGTPLSFLCKTLDEDVDDWESKWNDFLRYLNSIDFVNGTDYTKTFPELCDLS